MHDIVELEGRGVPGVYVASSEFKAAGEAQAEALGYDPAAVYVRHPIQDRTDDEMKAIARDAVNDVLKAVRAA
ncbi:MAG: hypothetical protein JRK53_09845 [Deltaproteobacteria bacterium]|nr:hypothetical protein [Deltaproteobacteria bacterium]MBW1819243.1 hypothetical protein [Deltaproteobacteria bacterium]MBW2285468.1 hypothetical protein [Deltaproteobacteria bacterium]